MCFSLFTAINVWLFHFRRFLRIYCIFITSKYYFQLKMVRISHATRTTTNTEKWLMNSFKINSYYLCLSIFTWQKGRIIFFEPKTIFVSFLHHVLLILLCILQSCLTLCSNMHLGLNGYMYRIFISYQTCTSSNVIVD